MLQDFRRRTTPDTGAARLAALRARDGRGGRGRLPRAAGRRAPGRERGAARRAAGLADRLHRLGRDRGRSPPTGRRSSSTGATGCRCRARSTPGASRCGASRRTSRPTGWPRRCRGGGRLGFDPWLHTAQGGRGAGRGARAAADRPGAGGEPRRRGPGPTSRRRPPGRSCRIRWRSPGGPPPTSAARSPRASSRATSPRRC